ncbi:MAG: alkaline phosphatase family protein [Acidobacteriota bacterium]
MVRRIAFWCLGGLAVTVAVIAIGWRSTGEPARPRVILLGLDGAGWNTAGPLLEAGDLPNLKALIAEGCSGSLASMSPVVSPRIWTSIATGKTPRKHGILQFTYKTPGGSKAPVHRGLRRCKAVWNILSERGVKVTVVNWWATWPAEQVNGIMVSDRLRFGASRKYPACTLVQPKELMQELNTHIKKVDGTFDREGRSAGFPVDWLREGAVRDPLFQEMRRMFPMYYAHESTVRSVGLATLGHDFDFYAIVFRMIDVSSHCLQYQLDLDRLPQMSAQERDLAFMRTIRPAWLFCDELIGKFRERNPRATYILVSDHGFCYQDRHFGHESSETGPAPGIFVGSGGAFMKGARVDGASILDITPTILRLYGLAAANDMDGRSLDSALDLGRLPPLSAEAPQSYDQGWKNETDTGGATETEVMQDLKALGYIQ